MGDPLGLDRGEGGSRLECALQDDRAAAEQRGVDQGLGQVGELAASDMSSSSSADASSGAALSASREVSSGAAGMCALAGGLAVVQRCAHDMASLQYQRMSAHA
jgi:hypothetical protein